MSKEVVRAGRKTQYTKSVLQNIKDKLELYIEQSDIPIVSEFAYMNHIPRQTLYEFEELRDTLGELIDKKEAQLEKLGLFNVVNASLAKFSLAQLGWKERQDISIGGSDTPLEVQQTIDRIKAKVNDSKGSK